MNESMSPSLASAPANQESSGSRHLAFRKGYGKAHLSGNRWVSTTPLSRRRLAAWLWLCPLSVVVCTTGGSLRCGKLDFESLKKLR